MPAIQTSYGTLLQPAVPGQIADMRNRTVISCTLQTGPVAFGVAVLRGTADLSVVPVGTAGATLLQGITVLDPTVRPLGAAPDQYQQYDITAVLLKGIVWVRVGSNVTPGLAAYYDASGNITGTTTSNTAIPNATFESTAASGALAKLRLG